MRVISFGLSPLLHKERGNFAERSGVRSIVLIHCPFPAFFNESNYDFGGFFENLFHDFFLGGSEFAQDEFEDSIFTIWLFDLSGGSDRSDADTDASKFFGLDRFDN